MHACIRRPGRSKQRMIPTRMHALCVACVLKKQSRRRLSASVACSAWPGPGPAWAALRVNSPPATAAQDHASNRRGPRADFIRRQTRAERFSIYIFLASKAPPGLEERLSTREKSHAGFAGGRRQGPGPAGAHTAAHERRECRVTVRQLACVHATYGAS